MGVSTTDSPCPDELCYDSHTCVVILRCTHDHPSPALPLADRPETAPNHRHLADHPAASCRPASLSRRPACQPGASAGCTRHHLPLSATRCWPGKLPGAGKTLSLPPAPPAARRSATTCRVLAALLEDPETRALYLFPTKALAQDQLSSSQQPFQDPSINHLKTCHL